MGSSVEIVAGISVERHESLDSTSLAARRLVGRATPPSAPRLIVAKTQTSGRGRHGRAWSSPVGGLWCTLVWPIVSPAKSNPGVLDGLGLRIGVGCTGVVARASARAGAPHDVRLKWPNDVLIDGWKVLGILTEVIGPVILVGVGINANFRTTDLPPELSEQATTLLEQLGEPVDLEVLLADLCTTLVESLGKCGLDPATLDEARSHLYGIGGPITVIGPGGAAERGELLGLGPDGIPVVRTKTSVIGGTPVEVTPSGQAPATFARRPR